MKPLSKIHRTLMSYFLLSPFIIIVLISFIPRQATRIFNVSNKSDRKIDKITIKSGKKTCSIEIDNLSIKNSISKQIDLLSENCHKECSGHCRGVFYIEAISEKGTLSKGNFGYYDLGYPNSSTELFDVRIYNDTIIVKQSFLK